MKELDQYKKDGLVDLSDIGVIQITKRGEFFSRHIAYVFDRFYRSKSGE
jgi:coproporphyrinogen III oxidase-like Fe-S oxidoreductase